VLIEKTFGKQKKGVTMKYVNENQSVDK